MINCMEKCGAVTFLDVLGWKGIWKDIDNPQRNLIHVIEKAKELSKDISCLYPSKEETERGKNMETNVLSISDTIVLFTVTDFMDGVEIQARICSQLIPFALENHIPLRGAIGFGTFFQEDNIFLGQAVDEVACWYETTDWIGVVLTPSAYLKAKDNTSLRCITEYNSIPFKHAEKNLTKCVDWEYKRRMELTEIIFSKGPLTPEIAGKYLNTLAFLDRKKKAQ